MKTIDDRVISSSDRLLHDMLAQRSWVVTSANELTLLRQGERKVPSRQQDLGPAVDLGPRTQLLGISKSGGTPCPKSDPWTLRCFGTSKAGGLFSHG